VRLRFYLFVEFPNSHESGHNPQTGSQCHTPVIIQRIFDFDNCKNPNSPLDEKMDQSQMDQSTEDSRLELEQRLLLAGDAHDNSTWRKLDSRSYVEESKITPADIPGLIEIMMIWDDGDKLDAWVESKADENYRELPIHAWRALGELRAEEAIEPLLRLAQTIADEDD